MCYNQGTSAQASATRATQRGHRISGRFKGTGLGYRFARYKDDERGIDVTVGNFYDQFGSGLIFVPTRSGIWASTTPWMVSV